MGNSHKASQRLSIKNKFTHHGTVSKLGPSAPHTRCRNPHRYPNAAILVPAAAYTRGWWQSCHAQVSGDCDVWGLRKHHPSGAAVAAAAVPQINLEGLRGRGRPDGRPVTNFPVRLFNSISPQGSTSGYIAVVGHHHCDSAAEEAAAAKGPISTRSVEGASWGIAKTAAQERHLSTCSRHHGRHTRQHASVSCHGLPVRQTAHHRSS
jgi:hypothetical protein